MQVKGQLTNVVIIIVSLFLLVMSYVIYSQEKEQEKLFQKYTLQKVNNSTFHEMLFRNQKAVISSDYVSISPTSLMFNYDKGRKEDYWAGDILRERIILFVPEKACNVCYDEIYEILQYAQDSLMLIL